MNGNGLLPRCTLVLTLLLALLVAGCADSQNSGPAKEADTAPATEASDCRVSPPEQPTACTMQYDPVCGCDGKTYSNACMASAAGVPRSEPGPCEEEELT